MCHGHPAGTAGEGELRQGPGGGRKHGGRGSLCVSVTNNYSKCHAILKGYTLTSSIQQLIILSRFMYL